MKKPDSTISLVRQVTKHGRVIAAAGRRIDAEDADVLRFPLDRVDETRGKIRAALVECGAIAVVSSAACGADLLALAEAGTLGLRRRVVLPFDAVRFKQISVTDRPGDWAPLFDEIVRQVEASGDLVVLDEQPGDAGYAVATDAVLTEAEAMARQNGGRPAAMVIWDGRMRPGIDLTQHFRDTAGDRGFDILDIFTLKP